MAIIYRGRVFSVEVGPKRFPDGSEHQQEIVRHPASVVLIPMRDAQHVILIRQWRAPVERYLWELPAGSLNEGETVRAAAARECEEEVGLAPGRIEELTGLFPSPGFCDEEMIFCRLWDLKPPAPDSPHKPDEDERIEAETFTIAEAKAMAARGEIADLKPAYGWPLTGAARGPGEPGKSGGAGKPGGAG
jgi:ADP-ribose pyrophosphatase